MTVAVRGWKVIGYCDGVPWLLTGRRWRWQAARRARKAMRLGHFSHVIVERW